MKNIRSILSHLVNQPQFKILKKQSCYHKFISLLTPELKTAVAFIYIKNNILFVATSHTGYKMELNYKQDLLKSLLKILADNDKGCSDLKAERVIIFKSKFYVEKPIKIQDTDPRYRELSSGEFKIQSKDKNIIKSFENIKRIILQNRNT